MALHSGLRTAGCAWTVDIGAVTTGTFSTYFDLRRAGQL